MSIMALFYFRENLDTDDIDVEEQLDDNTNQVLDMEVNHLIDIGLELSDTLPLITKALEGMAITSYIVLASSLTLSLYILIVSTILRIISDEVYYPTLSLFYICMSITFYIRLFYLMNSGHQLAEAMKKSKMCLERFRREQSYSNFTNDSKFNYKIDLLNSKLSNETPIKPYAMIGISNQVFLGTITSIITYLLILMRFRGGEMSACCDMCNNTTV